MNRHKYLQIALLFSIFLPFGHAFAADTANGKILSRQCSSCHGKNGIANDPMVANLAGQTAMYLEKSMKDFRSGARQSPQMGLMVQNLSDQDIKDLAAWYASFIVEVRVPE